MTPRDVTSGSYVTMLNTCCGSHAGNDAEIEVGFVLLDFRVFGLLKEFLERKTFTSNEGVTNVLESGCWRVSEPEERILCGIKKLLE